MLPHFVEGIEIIGGNGIYVDPQVVPFAGHDPGQTHNGVLAGGVGGGIEAPRKESIEARLMIRPPVTSTRSLHSKAKASAPWHWLQSVEKVQLMLGFFYYP